VSTKPGQAHAASRQRQRFVRPVEPNSPPLDDADGDEYEDEDAYGYGDGRCGGYRGGTPA
jgi:hypothetical protein